MATQAPQNAPSAATEALFELVRTGLGVSVVARWAVARRVRDGELVAIPLTKTGRQRTWSAAVRKAIANRSAIHTLVALLRNHAPAFQAAPQKRRVASRPRARDRHQRRNREDDLADSRLCR